VRAISLQQGWNLISFDVMPFDAAIGSVLAGIAGKYDRVLAFDCNAGTPGQTYYPDLPGVSNLRFMDPYHGYWIHMTQAATLTVQGIEVDDSSPLYLCAGWNLISYLPNAPLPVATALNSLAGVYTVVLGWEGGALSHYPELPASLNTLHQLRPLHGYWVRITRPATQVYAEGLVVAASDLTPNVTSAFEPPSNQWADFVALNARFQGQPIPVGTVIQAYTGDGILCGEVTVTLEGAFMIAVYGDDPTTPEKEGAVVGDEIKLFADGTLLRTAPRILTWPGDRERVDILVEPLEVNLPLLLR